MTAGPGRISIQEWTAMSSNYADLRRGVPPTTGLAGEPTAEDPGPAEEAPDRLGDFRILRELGRGGMGVVYEAEQESLGRRVALKILPSWARLDPYRRRRFVREARVVARLHHTNIVPVYGVGEHDGVPYYVMQFIEGCGVHVLLDRLRRLRRAGEAGLADTVALPALGPCPSGRELVLTASFARGPVPDVLAGSFDDPSRTACWTVEPPADPPAVVRPPAGRAYWCEVARIGVQVAAALDYASRQGILHRDVKPSNLLLDRQGRVWVTDFGLAKVAADVDDLTQTGDLLGTLRYMAPERFEGRSDVRSDVYSLGLTLYELLVLRPAFTESDRCRLVHRLTHREPVPPRHIDPAVPRDLETVVLKAIARDPARRYPTPAELAADLTRFIEDRPIRARRVGWPGRLVHWCRRNRRLAAATGLAVGGLLSATAVSTLMAVQQSEFAARQAETVAALTREQDQTRQARDEAQAALERSRRLAVKLAQARPAQAARAQALAGRWDEAAAHFAHAVAQDPRRPDLWAEKADCDARRGRWQTAAADFRRALELDPGEPWIWYRSAAVRLRLADRDGYRRHCAELLRRFGHTADPVVAERVAKLCVLVPGAVPDLSRPRALAGQAVASTEHLELRPWFLLADGMAAYRTGHWAEALDRLREAEQAYGTDGPEFRCQAEWFVAMTAERLGRPTLAREALARAEALLDAQLRQWPRGRVGTNWDDWLFCLAARDEARAVVKSTRR
jgi:serine/threonine protein kinase/tetratricopeptide (TPR) repeat protein